MTYETHNKLLSYAQGVKLAMEFCDVNGLPHAMIQSKKAPKRQTGKHSTAGYYSPERKVIQVFPERCVVAMNSPYQWTWPGYFADMTCLGVMLHELGHHVHFTHELSQQQHPWTLQIKSSWKPIALLYSRDVKPFEKPVTSYGATNASEGIAEAMKVYVSNPTLLLALFPFHYKFFFKTLNLKPVVTQHWSEILAKSQRHLDAVKRKLLTQASRVGIL